MGRSSSKDYLLRLQSFKEVLQCRIRNSSCVWMLRPLINGVVEEVLDMLGQADFTTTEKEAVCNVLCGGLDVFVLHHVIILEYVVGNRNTYSAPRYSRTGAGALFTLVLGRSSQVRSRLRSRMVNAEVLGARSMKVSPVLVQPVVKRTPLTSKP